MKVLPPTLAVHVSRGNSGCSVHTLTLFKSFGVAVEQIIAMNGSIVPYPNEMIMIV